VRVCYLWSSRCLIILIRRASVDRVWVDATWALGRQGPRRQAALRLTKCGVALPEGPNRGIVLQCLPSAIVDRVMDSLGGEASPV
jgi:hypothetical protein